MTTNRATSALLALAQRCLEDEEMTAEVNHHLDEGDSMNDRPSNETLVFAILAVLMFALAAMAAFGVIL